MFASSLIELELSPTKIEPTVNDVAPVPPVASKSNGWVSHKFADVADAVDMGVRRECARRMSADSASVGMEGSILI